MSAVAVKEVISTSVATCPTPLDRQRRRGTKRSWLKVPSPRLKKTYRGPAHSSLGGVRLRVLPL
jgi:hypothetical protein